MPIKEPETEEKKSGHGGRKATDLVGRTFGQLTVIERAENKKSRVCVKCRCSCGNIIEAPARNLIEGKIKSCGCLPRMRSRKMDITGRRYGKLVALYPTGEINSVGAAIWKCRCDCGNEVDVSVAMLNKGNNKSCGCLKEKSKRQVRDRLHVVDGTCIEWLKGREKRSDNTSGFRGVFKKKNGKYTVSIGFKKKIYYVGIYEDFNDAVEAKLRMEELVHKGFVNARSCWEEIAERDPDWAAAHPFVFDLKKENGEFVIYNSMECYMRKTDWESNSKSLDTDYLNVYETVVKDILKIDMKEPLATI